MRAVITVIGKDMVGILARVSTQCAQHKINVLEVTQSILQDMFAMIMMVEISDSDIPFTQFAEELAAIGNEMNLSIHAMHEDIFNSMHNICTASSVCRPENARAGKPAADHRKTGPSCGRKGMIHLCSTPTIYWKPSP